MQSVRQTLPSSTSEYKSQNLQQLDVQLSRLEEDFLKTEQLKILDKTNLTQIGFFRMHLNILANEINKANDPDLLDKIVYSYRDLFAIQTAIDFKRNFAIAEHLGELFILLGSLGKIYDYVYGSRSVISMLSWSSIALGFLSRTLARMFDSVNHQVMKFDKINKQISQPLCQIISEEKISNFEQNAYQYLHTRVKFFKTNFKSLNSIMLRYPTPTDVLRLLLDCYRAIHDYDYEDITEIRQMIDGCFSYLYITNGTLDITQKALYEEFYEEITPTNKTNRLTPLGSENGLI